MENDHWTHPYIETALFFLGLGVIGFGGPQAHIALMQERAVRRRGWLSDEEFRSALAVTSLIPGPNSTEMAIHVGWLRNRRAGGLLAGVAFILPAFLLMLALSWAYFRYDNVGWIEDFFYGVKPVVPGIVAVTAWRLTRGALSDRPLIAIALLAFTATLLFPLGEPLYLVAAGVAGITLYTSSGGSRALALLPFSAPPLLLASAATYGKLAWVFFKAGALLFGGGYVMIPLIQGDVVDTYGWLSEEEFLDGIALGQSTPGPIVITATFVGYAAAGWWGAVLATVVIFLPSFLFVLFGTGPFLQRFRDSERLRAFLKGAGAAVVGALFAAAVLLLRDAVIDVPTALLAAAGIALLLSGRVQMVLLIAAAGLAGLAIQSL
ncbi:MAG: chromate efflux transporter [Dehalococcoidia bacterium]